MMMDMALFFARLSLNSVLKPKALLSVHPSCNNPTDLDMDLEQPWIKEIWIWIWSRK